MPSNIDGGEGQGNSEDYKKFSGRRIYSVRDWLHSRFHLLDLYFNIANVPDSIQKYNMTTEQWEFLNNNTGSPTKFLTDNQRKDMDIVFKDIKKSIAPFYKNWDENLYKYYYVEKGRGKSPRGGCMKEENPLIQDAYKDDIFP